MRYITWTNAFLGFSGLAVAAGVAVAASIWYVVCAR
jgi:uncharacterized membrane protein YtjA (UPF0391 family)